MLRTFSIWENNDFIRFLANITYAYYNVLEKYYVYRMFFINAGSCCNFNIGLEDSLWKS